MGETTARSTTFAAPLRRDPGLSATAAVRAAGRRHTAGRAAVPGAATTPTATWTVSAHVPSHRVATGAASARHRRTPAPAPPAPAPVRRRVDRGLVPTRALGLLAAALLTAPVLLDVTVAPVVLVPLLVAVLGVLGGAALRLAGVRPPDPVARAVLALALGLLLLLGTALVLGALDAGAVTAALVLDALVVALPAAADRFGLPARAALRWRALRRTGPRLGLLLLFPVTAALLLHHPAAVGSVRTATALVLVATVTSLGVLTLRARPVRRTTAALLVHGTGWSLVVALATGAPSPAPTGSTAPGAAALTTLLADLSGSGPATVLTWVVPVLTALLPVLVWLVAERAVGPRRAPLVLTLFLAAAAWSAPVPAVVAGSSTALVLVTAAVLLVVSGRPDGAGRRVLVVALGAGATLTHAPTGAVFALQVLLVGLVALLLAVRPGRRAPVLLPLPLGLVLAATAAAWTVLTGRPLRSLLQVAGGAPPEAVQGGAWWAPPVGVALGAVVAVGFLALLLGQARPPVRDRQFLLLSGAAGALVLVALLVPRLPGQGAWGAVRAGLPVLAVPALLGTGALVTAAGASSGRLADALLRRRASRAAWSPLPPRHRARPGRVLRTALVVLLLFSTTTGLLPTVLDDGAAPLQVEQATGRP